MLLGLDMTIGRHYYCCTTTRYEDKKQCLSLVHVLGSWLVARLLDVFC